MPLPSSALHGHLERIEQNWFLLEEVLPVVSDGRFDFLFLFAGIGMRAERRLGFFGTVVVVGAGGGWSPWVRMRVPVLRFELKFLLLFELFFKEMDLLLELLLPELDLVDDRRAAHATAHLKVMPI
jgi:hypothetical protein